MNVREEQFAGALVAEAAVFSSATLHEAAGQTGALPSAIKPLVDSMRVCGPALTVQGAPGDNLWLHRAIAQARPVANLRANQLRSIGANSPVSGSGTGNKASDAKIIPAANRVNTTR